MDKHGTRAPAVMVELFKLLRSQWLSRRQITAELELHQATTARYVDQLSANGLLRDKKGKSAVEGGRAPVLYSLSPEWGGTAP